MTILRLVVAGMLAAAAFTAQAQNYSFSCITNNSAADCATGVAQFGMNVTVNSSDGFVDFLFSNTGPNESSITDIYFSWTAASGISLAPGILSSSGSGVSFAWGAAPPDLPGGGPYGFLASIGADSESPAQPMGINPGEWLSIQFTTDADLVAALDGGGLRVGIHTQGFTGGGSESFITPTTPIPEPQTYAMLIVGLGLLLFVRRRTERRLAAA